MGHTARAQGAIASISLLPFTRLTIPRPSAAASPPPRPPPPALCCSRPVGHRGPAAALRQRRGERGGGGDQGGCAAAEGDGDRPAGEAGGDWKMPCVLPAPSALQLWLPPRPPTPRVCPCRTRPLSRRKVSECCRAPEMRPPAPIRFSLPPFTGTCAARRQQQLAAEAWSPLP